jgi:hypothetical protein
MPDTIAMKRIAEAGGARAGDRGQEDARLIA